MSEQKTHILFYDPEENILAGLKRALHTLRRQWHMDFISHMEQAEHILLQQKPDVLVTDVSRSHKHGLLLLQKAKQSVPATIRIGISAETDDTTAIQALRPTHRFLAKPFEMEELKNIILRALFLRDKIHNPLVKNFVGRMEKLPSPPHLLQQINEALNQEDVSLKKIAALIENDINITSQLLKIVNSAYFGLFREVTSVQQSVSLLGLELIKNLILGISLFKGFDCAPGVRPLVEQVWQHSLTVARIMQQIVRMEHSDTNLESTAFGLGILHDAGKLIFAQILKEDYVQLFEQARRNNRPLWQMEKEQYGLTHADAGAYLFGLWGLPDILVDAVAESHDCETTESGSPYLARILRTADAVLLGREVPMPEDQQETETVRNWIGIAAGFLKDIHDGQ